ncbi:amino acid adenylation domain-containing protein [Blastococcus montanus]|uniref:non-ribosomal peptide synthetase n=1 Tax=Blastococcus montanus TaxID=3144973 RepID=UPI003207D480
MSTGAPGSPLADEKRRRLAEALRARRDAPARLAPNQERLWFLQQLDPGSVAYAESVVMRLSGPLDEEALLTAVRALPTRHEWLRSRVDGGPDGPVQVVDDRIEPDVVATRLAGAGPGPAGGRSSRTGNGAEEVLDEAALAWVRILVEEPFSPAEGRIWRAGLGRWSDEEHLLVLVVHHLACDASSLAVLVDEVGARYDALVTRAGFDRPVPRSARDVAREVRRLQTSPESQDAVTASADALLEAGVEAGQGQAGAGRPGPVAVLRTDLPGPLAEAVHRTAGAHDVAPFAVVCAGLGAAIAETLDVDTPVLGVPVDLRWRLDDGEDVVSFLVETVAVPLPDALTRSPDQVMTGIRDTVAAALQQPPPFDRVVDRLRQAGASSTTDVPLHAYVTWLDGGESSTLGAAGPAVIHLDPPLGEAKADLAWTVVSRDGGLGLRLEYDSVRIGHEAAGRLVADVVRLVELICGAPDVPVAGAERVEQAEAALIRSWEGRLDDVPRSDLVTTVWQAVARSPEPALVAGDVCWSGADLVARAERLAGALADAGVTTGTRVAVSSRRVPGMVVALLAVLRAGGTFLPIDSAHPSARQADLLRRSGASVVVGAESWAGALAEATGRIAVAVDDLGAPSRAPARTPDAWPQRSPDDLAYVLFTSGSTGRPKAVRVPDSAIVARVDSYRTTLAPSGVRYLLHSSLTFDAAMYLFWVLAVGGRLTLADDRQAVDPLALADLIEQHGITDTFFVPALYEAVLRVARPGALTSCRRLCVGGEVMPAAIPGLHQLTVPEAQLLNVYGPTETVVTATAAMITTDDLTGGRRPPIGRPHPGTLARVLDRHGRRVPVGTAGQLHLGGPCVADGYDDPDAPGRRMPAGDGPFSVVPDDGGRQVRWYATGDVVRWREDGRLDYVGRRDRQVKLRGQRVELGEVEAVARSMPGVRDAAVEMIEGPGDRHLVLFVEPELVGVREHLAARLPAAWLPEAVVLRSALPRLPSGKLDRHALRREAPPRSTAAVSSDLDDITRRGLGPVVLSVVRSVLDRQDVGPDDDFFEAGGNSLLAARLTGQLSAVLGAAIPLHELLSRSTPRGMTALAYENLGRDATCPQREPRLVAVRATGRLAPTVLVTRDGETSLVLRHFLARLDPERPVWALIRPMPPLGYDVPDLALTGELVAATLRERFPPGPVHLLGHSASGLVAVEAARRLGDRRGATVLLDTYAPPLWSRTPLRHVVAAADGVRSRLVLARRRVRAPAAGDTVLPSNAIHSLRLHQDSQAVLRLRMRPVDFPLTVLVAEASRGESRWADLGWHRWTPDVATVPVPGDHISLLVQPHVEQTTQRIEEVLGRWS